MLKKILKLITDILTCIIFLVLVIIIIAKVNMIVAGTNYFKLFGYSVFNVSTGSMEPAIHQNSLIIVKEASEYNVDDIVTFSKEDDFITHRIIKIMDDKVVTKGDANNTSDVAIKEELILGKVVKVFPNAGIWQKILTTPSIIIAIFVTLLLFDFAFSYKGFKKKKDKKIVKKLNDIDLKQIQYSESAPKLNEEELDNLCNKIIQVNNDESVKFDEKEKELLDYTIRLDLTKIQQNIDSNMKSEDK